MFTYKYSRISGTYNIHISAIGWLVVLDGQKTLYHPIKGNLDQHVTKSRRWIKAAEATQFRLNKPRIFVVLVL